MPFDLALQAGATLGALALAGATFYIVSFSEMKKASAAALVPHFAGGCLVRRELIRIRASLLSSSSRLPTRRTTPQRGETRSSIAQPRPPN